MPPFAFDAANNRFAVPETDTVSVVELTSRATRLPDDLHLATVAGHRTQSDADARACHIRRSARPLSSDRAALDHTDLGDPRHP